MKRAAPPLPPVTGDDRFHLVALLTLILLMQHGPGYWYIKSFILICCILGIVYRALAANYLFWLVVASLVNSANFHNWWSVDNHKYLLGYWCLALFLACAAPADGREEHLARAARLLIAGCLGFALVWKVISRSFRDGSFFEFTLITDPRFATVARWFGGLTPRDLAENEQRLDLLKLSHLGGYNLESVRLASSPRIRALAVALTRWTFLIEGSLAVAFALPGGRSTELLRTSLLIVFCLTTYAVATVQGFGWLLAIMGIAQLSRHPELATPLVAVIVILQFYMLPFGDFLAALR